MLSGRRSWKAWKTGQTKERFGGSNRQSIAVRGALACWAYIWNKGEAVSYTTLEDFFGDIVGKARRGLGMSESDLAGAADLSPRDVSQIESYDLTPDDGRIRKFAEVLGLDGRKLSGVAHGYLPGQPNASYETEKIQVERLILDAGMEVNAYILKCKATGKGAVVDAGGEGARIVSLVRDMQVEVTHILLTHGHGDHIGALEEVHSVLGGEVYCSRADAGMLGAAKSLLSEEIEEGWSNRVGELQVQAVALPGHTPGGIGFVTEGAVFSGDALFAGSLGGARGDAYTGQIRAVGEKILSKDPGTKVFPGHGPITTVGEEIQNNPFFA
jgi:glyoxylase-like metal-dependent hydrolase (beta-lactamase superfamily II)